MRSVAPIARLIRGWMLAWFTLRIDSVMAGCTGTGSHYAVVHTHAARPGRGGLMAAIARNKSRYMTCILAAVVAARAGAGRDAAVAHGGRGPGGGAVAGVARGGGLDVVRSLAPRRGAVVAGRATAGSDAIMVETCRRPTAAAAVAGFARCCGGNVVGRFCVDTSAPASDVATLAIARSTLEYARDMARLAANLLVLTGKRETGLEVIEACRSACSFGGTGAGLRECRQEST